MLSKQEKPYPFFGHLQSKGGQPHSSPSSSHTSRTHIHTLPFWIFAQLILLLRVKFMSYSAKSSLESMKKARDCVIHAWDEFNQNPASPSLDRAKNGFSDADAAAESWSWTVNEQGLSRGFSGILPFSPRSEDTSSSMFSFWRTLVLKWLIK